MGRKRFAKKSEEVRTFRLVARSQNDSHFDEDGATPLVLEPFAAPNASRRSGLSEAELLEVPESLRVLGPAVFAPEGREVFPEPDPRPSAVDKVLTKIRKGGDDEEDDEEDEFAHLDGDCYFPQDGYNYDQHLKRVSGVGKQGGVAGVILEPPKKLAEEIGLADSKEIGMQKPMTTEEAEMIRALEFAEEYEEMDEDFEQELAASGVLADEDVMIWGPTAAENRDLPDLAAFKAMYAARRGGDDEEGDEDYEYDEDGHYGGGGGGEAPNEEEFAAFLAAEYGDDDLGACDEDDIEGPVALENCEEVLDEYIQGRKDEEQKLLSLYEPQEGKLDDVPRVIEETKALIAKHYEGEQEDTDEESEEESDGEDRSWDCETVLSTLSNLSNRPGKIGKIKVLKAPKLNAVQEDDEKEDEESEEEEVVELPDVITTREKGETAEEKRARKAGVKEMRKICRKMKKESKETYKTEAAKLPANKGGSADLRQKTRCHRM